MRDTRPFPATEEAPMSAGAAKVLEYADRIRNVAPEADVLRDLPPGFANSVRERLAALPTTPERPTDASETQTIDVDAVVPPKSTEQATATRLSLIIAESHMHIR